MGVGKERRTIGNEGVDQREVQEGRGREGFGPLRRGERNEGGVGGEGGAISGGGAGTWR